MPPSPPNAPFSGGLEQIEFVGQLEKLHANKNVTDSDNDPFMLVLIILENIKETRLKFWQGIVTVYKRWQTIKK